MKGKEGMMNKAEFKVSVKELGYTLKGEDLNIAFAAYKKLKPSNVPFIKPITKE